MNALGLALSHLQRQAIVSDPRWQGGNYPLDNPPRDGLALARALATCTYKSLALLQQRFGRKPNRNGERPASSLPDRYDVAGYLELTWDLNVRQADVPW